MNSLKTELPDRKGEKNPILCLGKAPTILIVDDEPGILDAYSYYLAPHKADKEFRSSRQVFRESPRQNATPEYRLLLAKTGEEAVSLVRQHMDYGYDIQAGFFDMKMPGGIDGLETMRRVRQLDTRILCVVVTAYEDRSIEDIGQIFSPDSLDEWDYINKPFTANEIQQKARNIVASWYRRRRDEVYQKSLRDEAGLLEQEVEKKIAALDESNRALSKVSASLMRSEARLRVVIDSARDAIFILDKEGVVLEANPAAQVTFQAVQKMLRGRRFFTLFREGKDRDLLQAWFKRCRVQNSTGAIPDVMEVTAVDLKGSQFPFELTMNSLATPSGNCITVFGRDLTKQKKREEDLAQFQKLESVGRLAVGIAHEINTPAQYVRDNVVFLQESCIQTHNLLASYNELLAAAKHSLFSTSLVQEIDDIIEKSHIECLVENVPQAIEASLKGVSTISKIVSAMKYFSHPASQDKVKANVNKALSVTVTIARSEWKRVAEVALDLEENLPLVPCFVAELNQVWLNLTVNAAHAIAESVRDMDGQKGKITITSRRDGQWVEVRIADTGCGIPRPYQGKIFDRFFTTKEIGKGTGQGLSIARSHIVDRHGGTISFETEVGKGTTFIVRLPLAEPGV